MGFDDQRQCKRQLGMIVSMGKALGTPLTAVKNRLSKEAAKKPPPSPAEGSLFHLQESCLLLLGVEFDVKSNQG